MNEDRLQRAIRRYGADPRVLISSREMGAFFGVSPTTALKYAHEMHLRGLAIFKIGQGGPSVADRESSILEPPRVVTTDGPLMGHFLDSDRPPLSLDGPLMGQNGPLCPEVEGSDTLHPPQMGLDGPLMGQELDKY